MTEEILVEFLINHKKDGANFNEEGNYDPNPYWLAEDIMKLFNNDIKKEEPKLDEEEPKLGWNL